MRRDLLDEHLEDAAFLYARLRRSHRLLDGNATQTRSLLSRIDAHLDALSVYGSHSATIAGPPSEARGVGARFVATFVAAREGAGLETLLNTDLDHDGYCAVVDALERSPTAHARASAEAWLAEGCDAARAVGVTALARWRDPRAVKIATRAAKRGEGVLRAAGVAALAAQGETVATETVLNAMNGCRELGWRDELLMSVVLAAPAVALEVARRWSGARCDVAWVILGMSADRDDASRLLDALTLHGAFGALPAAVALAGAHDALDFAWEDAALPASNALREAAYVVLGGEAPPVVVRDDFAEEPEDTAQRAGEDVRLRAALAGRERAAGRWGEAATFDGMRRAAVGLGPRPQGWCRVGLTMLGG